MEHNMKRKEAKTAHEILDELDLSNPYHNIMKAALHDLEVAGAIAYMVGSMVNGESIVLRCKHLRITVDSYE